MRHIAFPPAAPLPTLLDRLHDMPAFRRLHPVLLSLALSAGGLLYVANVQRAFPLQHWLFPRYVGYTLACAALSAGCLGCGFRLVSLGRLPGLRFSERVLLGYACGVLVFGVGVFGAGLCQLYGTTFFFAWPALLAACGGGRSYRELLRGARRLARGPAALLPRSASELARLGLVALGLIAVYTQVITPENVSHDARWYHLGLADHYVAQGGIARFPEGWYLGAYPQLASWLYTWAYQLPGSVFDRITLCAHVEWTLFLATLPGMTLLVRRLVPSLRVRWGSAAVFLFPSVLLYDSNLNVGADHVLAFWAAPLAIAVAVALRRPELRAVVLVAALGSGALLTKYQAVYLVVPAAFVMLVGLVQARRPALIAVGLASVLVLTAPHWLKNLWFYGDPLYPMLHAQLPSALLHPGAAQAMEQNGFFPRQFTLHGSVSQRLGQTLWAVLSFSFVPHNWRGFGLDEPTFGSLFTLLTPCLLWLRRSARIWVLVACAHAGVFIWFWTNHQDRYLQALLPWMVACVVAISALVWRSGQAPRAALTGLLAFQLAWGSSMYLYSHRMIDGAPIEALAKLVKQGRERNYEVRFEHWGALWRVTEPLPSAAALLLHDEHLRAGFGRKVITDEWGYQGGLSYRELGSARAVWERWRALGATHVVWRNPRHGFADATTLARQAVFFEAALRATRDRRARHGYTVAELAPTPPPARPRLLQVEGCDKDPARGIYTIAAYARGAPALRPLHAAAADQVGVLALRRGCSGLSKRFAQLTRGFEKAAESEGLALWVRREPSAEPEAVPSSRDRQP